MALLKEVPARSPARSQSSSASGTRACRTAEGLYLLYIVLNKYFKLMLLILFIRAVLLLCADLIHMADIRCGLQHLPGTTPQRGQASSGISTNHHHATQSTDLLYSLSYTASKLCFKSTSLQRETKSPPCKQCRSLLL